MQADCRLVEHEHRIPLPAAHLAGQLEPLGLASGKAGCRLSKRQVSQSKVVKHLQAALHQGKVRAGFQRLVHAHFHELRQRMFALPAYLPCIARITGAVAVRTGDVHIRKELDIEADGARPVAGRTAEPAGVVGKIPRLPSACLGILGLGEHLPEFVVDVGVGRNGGAYVDADGRRVDELDLTYAVGLDSGHVRRQSGAVDVRLEPGNQTLQDHGCLAGAGHPRHDGETALRETDFQRLDGMDGAGAHAYASQIEKVLPPWGRFQAAFQIRAYP